MCSVGSTAPTNSQPQYVHNPYLDGGAYGNSVDANRIGTSALTIGLDPQSSRASAAIGTGATIPPGPGATTAPALGAPTGTPPPTSNTQPVNPKTNLSIN